MDTKQQLALIQGMQISTKARQSKYADMDLGKGLSAPFPVIGYKGSKWSVRNRGTTYPCEVPDATGRFKIPVPFLDLVVLYGAEHNSKTYYSKNYQDGDDHPPDCWSTDGIKPDAAAPSKQNPTCAGCKWNEFGSRMNQTTGTRGKACADFRRMAVVPYPDIENMAMGGGISAGPMLLRVPPASLGVLAEYSAFLKGNSIPICAVVVRLGFETQLAYPKFTMDTLRALTDDEMDRVIAMQAHPLVERIVQAQVENIVSQAPEPGATPATSKSDTGDDPGPIPDHLKRSNGTAAPTATVTPSAPVTPLGAQVSPSTQPAPSASPFAAMAPNPAVGGPAVQTAQPASQPAQAPQAAPAAPAAPVSQETPAETIARLQAELAAATGQAAKRPRKPRSQPVAPSTTAEPAPATTGLTAASGTPIVEDDEAADEESDPALASINERLGKVMN